MGFVVFPQSRRDGMSVESGPSPQIYGGLYIFGPAAFFVPFTETKKAEGFLRFFCDAGQAVSQAWCTGIGVGSSVMVTCDLMMS